MRTALFFLIWLACAVAVGSLVGGVHRPRSPRVEQQLTAFLEDKDSYDVVFLGSSRVWRGIVPKTFDGELKRRGFDVRSFNLGMRGTLPHEADELLRRVLAERPARLRWVVMELAEWTPQRNDPFTHRAVAWHDPTETLSVLRTSWGADEPLLTRLENVRIDLMQAGARLAALGLGAEAVRHRFEDLTRPPTAEDEEAERYLEYSRRYRGFGRFTVSERREGPTAKHRNEFLANRREFEDYVAGLPALNAGPAELDSYNLAALQGQIDRVRRAGLEIAYLIMPSYEAVPRLHRLAEAGYVPHLLAFDDPVAHPELYAVGHRFDPRHLDQDGAELFTTLLAERCAGLFAESD